jgi:hypothetical protein
LGFVVDINERAEKWAKEFAIMRANEHGEDDVWPEWYGFNRDDLITAYLAGSAQTQRDYAEHFSGQ